MSGSISGKVKKIEAQAKWWFSYKKDSYSYKLYSTKKVCTGQRGEKVISVLLFTLWVFQVNLSSYPCMYFMLNLASCKCPIPGHDKSYGK